MSTKIKTEHSGSKKGNGAFWGRKKEAKEISNKKRRGNNKREILEGIVGKKF